jgi:hypothetical protein
MGRRGGKPVINRLSYGAANNELRLKGSQHGQMFLNGTAVMMEPNYMACGLHHN